MTNIIGKPKDIEDVHKLLADAWLNITVDHERLFNPLDWPEEYRDDPALYLTWTLTRPEYFSFICEEILNIQLLPTQAMMLKELWNRRLPMLIASRGFGKLLQPDELIRIQNGWKKIKDVQVGDKVYGSDGELTKVTHKTCLQTNVHMYRITLRDGRQIDCCEDHMWKVWDKNKNRNKVDVVWSELCTKDLVKNYCWERIGDKSGGKEYRYAIPINQPLRHEMKCKLLIHPYIVGVLLGDGGITTQSTIITSTDHDIIDKVHSLLPKKYTIKQYDDKTFKIIRKDKTVPPFYKLLAKIGIQGHNSHTKFIPDDYQYSLLSQRMDLIRGLMDTDGYAKKSVIEYYTVSKRLSADFLNVARSCGLHCKHATKQSWFKGKRYANCNRITIYTKQPIFYLKRKLDAYINHDISKQGASKYDKVFITNIEYIGLGEGHCISVDNDDHTYITKDYIVTHNSMMLAVYALLRILLMPARKVVLAGAVFRQSKVIFEYMEHIYHNAPMLQNVISSSKPISHDTDMYRFRVGNNTCTALPIGDGTKIRGQRANDLITDEFASLQQQIFENVLAGFAAVKASPVEGVQAMAAIGLAKKYGIELDDPEEDVLYKDNQIVISGTAYYDFNHFAQYHKDWHEIICTRGEKKRLDNYYFRKSQEKGIDLSEVQRVDPDHYSIIRIPFELVPKGFMDEAQVARSRATIHAGIYLMEFGACFSTDSSGFYKRKLIESCCVSPHNEISFIDSGPVFFEASLYGQPNKTYVYGIDPASEQDNFSIVVIECWSDHRRIVYCWTTTRDQHMKEIRDGLVDELDFYSYCSKKVRWLMLRFPCERIMLDSQGGGIGIMEALHDPDKMGEGELQIWPIVDPDKKQSTDRMPGLHILEMVNFASADWTHQANNGMRKDLEDKVLLFPYFDPVTLANALGEDTILGRSYDTLEACVMELEELKDELCTIVITQTPNTHRDRWDTPEVKLPGGRKGRMRKDRYSALLMANMGARSLVRVLTPPNITSVGGFAGKVQQVQDGPMYVGGDPTFTAWAEEFYR